MRNYYIAALSLFLKPNIYNFILYPFQYYSKVYANIIFMQQVFLFF